LISSDFHALGIGARGGFLFTEQGFHDLGHPAVMIRVAAPDGRFETAAGLLENGEDPKKWARMAFEQLKTELEGRGDGGGGVHLHITCDECQVLAEAARRMVESEDHGLTENQWRALAVFIWSAHHNASVKEKVRGRI
jgi:hypothetical protein